MEWLASAYQTASTAVAIGLLVLFGLRAGDRKNLKDQLNEERASKAELRNDRDDAVKERDEERAARAAEAEGFRTKIEALRQDVSTLTRTMTGEVHWVAVGEQLDALAEAIKGLRDDVTALLTKLGSPHE